jgi:hypothetical protein
VVRSAVLISAGLSEVDVSKMLNNELVGVDGTEYGQMRTTAGEKERWATA